MHVGIQGVGHFWEPRNTKDVYKWRAGDGCLPLNFDLFVAQRALNFITSVCKWLKVVSHLQRSEVK